MTKFGRACGCFVAVTDDPYALEAISEILYLRYNRGYCIQVEILGYEKPLYNICIQLSESSSNALKTDIAAYLEMKHIRVIPEER